MREYRVAQDAEDVAQRHRLAVQRAGAEAARGELTVQVPDREPVLLDVELGMGVRRAAAEWIEVRDQVTAHRYMFTSWWTLTTFSNAVLGSSSGLTSVLQRAGSYGTPKLWKISS